MTIEELKEQYKLTSDGKLYKLGIRTNGHTIKGEWKQVIFKANTKKGYCVSSIKSKSVFSHRVVMSLKLDRLLLPHEQVDHIDRNKINNHPDNLRLVTNRENSSNYEIHQRKPVGTSFIKSRNKYTADIQINGNRVGLGIYLSEEDASNAYQLALKNIDKYEGHNMKFRELIFGEEPKGVAFDKRHKKWKAYKAINKKRHNLGTYVTKKEAQEALNLFLTNHYKIVEDTKNPQTITSEDLD